ncbi:MAG: hypothetical protein SGARI_003848, partial [Bacillariaceae sp.]
MVDTSDPEICTWSEDGETFIIKDTQTFEKKIIPQFFKHNKFSSFVRQLNFYSFRKIRFDDSVRIDQELEAKTANFWRFYHPKFQKGHPEWLTDIKRSISQTKSSASAARPFAVTSSNVSDPENIKLKTEVTSLKERIEAMTKNIDQLTTMVQQVTLNPPQAASVSTASQEDLWNDNHKRVKVEASPALSSAEPEPVFSAMCPPAIELYSPMETENGNGKYKGDDELSPSMPTPVLLPPLRETSITPSEVSDGFVERLFTDFSGDLC